MKLLAETIVDFDMGVPKSVLCIFFGSKFEVLQKDVFTSRAVP